MGVKDKVYAVYFLDKIEYICFDKETAEKVIRFLVDTCEHGNDHQYSIEECSIINENDLKEKTWWHFVFDTGGSVTITKMYKNIRGENKIVSHDSHFHQIAVDVCCEDKIEAFKIAKNIRDEYLLDKLGLTVCNVCPITY